MKEIIMMIDNTKMNILNDNIVHHHPLLHLLNTVLEFDQNYYHIELIQKVDIAITQTIVRESIMLNTYKRGCYDLFEMEDKARSKLFENQFKAKTKNKQDSSKYYLQQGFFKLTKDLRSQHSLRIANY